MGVQRKHRRALRATFAISIAAALCAIAAPTTFALTLGSDLARDPDTSLQGTVGPLTVFNSFLDKSRSAEGRVAPWDSPVNGTVVLWRIRTGDTDTGPVRLRIIRNFPAAAPAVYAGAGSSPYATPGLNTVSSYPSSLPIHVHDTIGIDCCSPDFGQYFVDTSGPQSRAHVAIWEDPSLSDGASPTTPSGDDYLELALNADIVPDATVTVLGTKVSHKHRVRIEVHVANSGTLTAGPVLRHGKRSTSSTPSRPRRVIKPTTQKLVGYPAAAGIPGSITVEPTRRASRLLRAGNSLSAKIRLAFTTIYGGTSTKTLKVRLPGS